MKKTIKTVALLAVLIPHCQARGAGGAGMKKKKVPPERHPMA